MIKGNYFSDNENLQFYFKNYIPWNEIVPLKEKDYKDAKEYAKSQDALFEYAPTNLEESVEGYQFVLDAYGDLSGNYFAEDNKKIAHEGLKLENGKVIFPQKIIDNVNKVIEAGILPYAVDRELEGLNMPFSTQAMILDIMASANPTLSITVGCFNLSDVIESFASHEMAKEWVPKMSRGEWCGAMALTEPDFGSNLPGVKTKAVLDDDGVWRLSGSKIFITLGGGFGDKPTAILTLARSSKTSGGAKGLSFFLVKSTDVEVVRIEEKIGLHASATCQLAYDNAPAELIGKENLGLVKYSMAMMNGARLGIAAQSVGMMQGAVNEAVKYARERVQFDKLIQEIPAVKKLIDNSQMELAASRTLLYESAYMVDMFVGLSKKYEDEGLTEKEIRKKEDVKYFDKMSKLMTPLVKLYSSELVNKVVYDCLQVFGGSGYTEEYDIADFYRDARIASIYEGTSQLQSLAAIGQIVEGLGGNGIFSQYIEKLLSELPSVDVKLKDAIVELKKLVLHYKTLDKEVKDAMAMEVAMTTAAILNALLLEKANSKENVPASYKAISVRYLKEALARLAASKVRLEFS